MKRLILTYGAPASGKSHWVNRYGLTPYCISSDDLRNLIQSPVLTKNGTRTVCQDNDDLVWDFLMRCVEDKMSRGELIVVDATHYKKEYISKYKRLVKDYGYSLYVVDFSNVPLDVLLDRNGKRTEGFKVPKDTIVYMHSVMMQNDFSGTDYRILSPNDFSECFYLAPFDFSRYVSVVHFGDIHGCMEPLKEYFRRNPIKLDIAYVFVGDYLDRGVQNAEVLEFIMDKSTLPNFYFLEGNHEKHLRKYAESEDSVSPLSSEELDTLRKYLTKSEIKKIKSKKINSREFCENTIPQIKNFDKRLIRQFLRRLRPLLTYKYAGLDVLVTHGGIPCAPSTLFSEDTFIKGVGAYDEVKQIDGNFVKNTDLDISIHGHRNIDLDISEQFGGRVYNLCDRPEKGGSLRVLTINIMGDRKVELFKNDVYNREVFG